MSSMTAAVLAAIWRASKKRLDAAKKDEMKWRNLIAANIFSHAVIGTNRATISGDEDLRLVRKQNVTMKWDEVKWSTMWFKATPEQQAELSKLVQQEWTFDQTAYKSLSDAAKKLVDDCGILEIKDGTPTLDIAAAKKEDI